MKKVLIVSNKNIYLEDIAFFYDIEKVEDSKKAIEIVDEKFDLAILEEDEYLDEFLDVINENLKIQIKFIIISKDIDKETMRKYFKKNASDVIEEELDSIKLLEKLEELETVIFSKADQRKIEFQNKELEMELTEYQISYETTKLLRLDLEFKEVIKKIIKLIEGLTGGAAILKLYGNLSKTHYYNEESNLWKIELIRDFLRKNGYKSLRSALRDAEPYKIFEFQNKACCVLPMVIHNQLEGHLVLINNKKIQLESIELGIFNTILSQAGIVIENAELMEHTKAINFQMAKSLVKAIEAKDIYTKGHSERVASLSTLIAKKMDFDLSKVKQITMAAMLHDVGKIGLSENILNKKSDLTFEEYNEIKKHSQNGYEIVYQIENMREIAEIIKSHHERWDGTGYPDKLYREEIRLESRIIAIADAFDAMTSDRPYRSGMEVNKALRIIEENKHTQFDAEIVNIFLGINKNKIIDIIEKIK
ncbi:MAG: hypothetical protein B6I28_03390 [Fusobacteriia bacterium 4572_132]|nr:MAG: hypothetical protein B6I28_03390 [Fusobacteriia bacterium 4572_132]